jgi:hypothetical protein
MKPKKVNKEEDELMNAEFISSLLINLKIISMKIWI